MNTDSTLRYSRQIYTLGKEAVTCLGGANILLLGFRGVGAEAAKNLVLLGVRSITIVDLNSTDDCATLSSHIFLGSCISQEKIASASLGKLQALNPTVEIKYLNNSPDPCLYDGVIVTDQPVCEGVLELSNRCHAQNIPFVFAQTSGVVGRIFCDFAKFKPKGGSAEIPEHRILKLQIQENRLFRAHLLLEGDEDPLLHNKEVIEIFSSLERTKLWKAQVKECEAPMQQLCWISFELEDSTDFPLLNSLGNSKNGYNNQHKGGSQQKETTFLLRKVISWPPLDQTPLGENLHCSPRLAVGDCGGGKKRKCTQHVGFHVLETFRSYYQRNPKPEDLDCFFYLAEKYKEKISLSEELDLNVLKTMALTSEGDLSPIAMVIGGIVVQEVVKGICRQVYPVNQWFYFDAMELVDVDAMLANPENFVPSEDKDSKRYDGNIRVLGKANQEKLHQSAIFLVGCGAVGCETLKCCALLGIGTKADNGIVVTDNDAIEKSNLSRQFLFTDSDIGKYKSEVAARAVKAINPFARVSYLTEKVGEEFEETFDDKFFESIDAAVTALDNMPARYYIDKKCVFYGISFINPGTQGTQASVEVVLNGITPSLNQRHNHMGDPAAENSSLLGGNSKKEFAPCTLSFFPHKIEHTLAWAKDCFIGYFSVTHLEKYLAAPKTFLETLQGDMKAVAQDKLLALCSCYHNGKYFEAIDCIAWARNRFQEDFINKIERMHQIYPPDSTTENGELFWSGTKTLPTVIEFDRSNSLHIDFIYSAALLRAKSLNVEFDYDVTQILNALDALVDEWKNYPVRETSSESAKKSEDSKLSEKEVIQNCDEQSLLRHIPATFAPQNIAPVGLSFEKDDNLHMLFVNSASNLRAENYSIPGTDLNTARKKVGNIIPAIITTTAVVSGLACIELLKTLLGKGGHKEYSWDLSSPRGWYNLQLNYTLRKKLIGPCEYTEWDFIEVNDMKLIDLLYLLKTEYQLENITYVLAGDIFFYDSSNPHASSCLPQSLSEIWTDLKLPKKTRYLFLTIVNDEEELVPLKVALKT